MIQKLYPQDEATDFKSFVFAGQRVGIAQVEMPDARPLVARRVELLEAMERMRSARNLRQVILIGIDSISLNPDTVLKTTLAILCTERAAKTAATEASS